MVLNLRTPDEYDLRARIAVFGVGGAGGNAINNMIEKKLEGVEFIAANTDAQALSHSRAPRKIQLGGGVTRGLGAGSKPDVGMSAAEESIEEIANHLDGCHMCFITGGMGGGTGTGAAPVVARIAREMGILTVGVVTKPFAFEGARRMMIAEAGVEAMQSHVDTLIVIPNQNLFQVASERTTFVEAFQMADDVLYQGVQGVTDLMVRPGMINLDFADVRSVMEEMGKAMMGTGEAEGETRATDAAEKAIANPLLDEVSLKGAKGVLINITGGYDLTLFEMDEAANRIKEEVDANALIKFGSAIDPEMEGKMRVSVVATGIDAEAVERAPVETQTRRRPAVTDPSTLSAIRAGRGRAETPVTRATATSTPAGATAPAERRAEPAAEAPEAEAERPAEPAAEKTASPAPAAEQRSAPAARGFSTPSPRPHEAAAMTAPSPDDIRARAEEVRRRAAAARAEHESARSAEHADDVPGLFDLDDRSLDRPSTPRAEAAPATEAAAGGRQLFRNDPLTASRGAETHATPAAGQPAAAEQAAPRPAAQRSGGLFAISSLINRVSGGAHADPAPQRAPASHQRHDVDDDDGDIPAFLRRQAN
ncbi:cell division protein FtsZ [Limibaculum sp. M0105]|uniref:Cell division protein FtsZ n=1 Tax=Thermohalobaculum xanthum TaxID=2753746 RepID=A0A8J7M7A6_9RHOB|nr:cell division protein FtsZ [Thermohalobaculum xanthum]MBK0399674.1 cell division protein FtsZ [Thermohalobaculum xanthum]